MRLPTFSRATPEATFVKRALRGGEPGADSTLAEAATDIQNWTNVAFLGVQHHVSPWLLESLARAGLTDLLPEPALDAIQQEAKNSAFQSLLLSQSLLSVYDALEQAGVPAMLLKGPAIAERFYPKPSLRPYTDIDLLVPLEHHEKTVEVCTGLGYELAEDHGGVGAAREGTCEWPFEASFKHRDSAARLDVHYDHFQIGLRPRGLAEIWQQRESHEFMGRPMNVLGLHDLFLFLCVHLNRHGFAGLIWFKDIDLIVRRNGDQLDWRRLSDAAASEGVLSSLSHTLRLVSKLLDTPLPAAAEAIAAKSRRSLFHRFLWRESDIIGLKIGRWRRAVQFVPEDGVRGALPSIFVMGRRFEKLQALWRRASR